MNRATIVVFAICLLAAIVTIGVILVRAMEFPSEAQSVLSQYVQYRYPMSEPATVERVVRSSLPGNFSAAMSRATFGGHTPFRTTYSNRAQPVNFNLPGSPTVTPDPNAWRTASGGVPVPFPPMDVWCVSLKAMDQSSPAIVYVAMHQDLYYAGWLVHEPEGDAKEIAAALNKIGCDLKLGE